MLSSSQMAGTASIFAGMSDDNKMDNAALTTKSMSTLPLPYMSPFSDSNRVDNRSEDFHQVGVEHPNHMGMYLSPPSAMAANVRTPQKILSFQNPSNSPLDVPLPAGKDTFGTYLLPYMNQQ